MLRKHGAFSFLKRVRKNNSSLIRKEFNMNKIGNWYINLTTGEKIQYYIGCFSIGYGIGMIVSLIKKN